MKVKTFSSSRIYILSYFLLMYFFKIGMSIRNGIADFLNNEVGIKTVDGSAINQFDYTTVQILRGKNELVVYITGLTPVVAELIRQCALNGVSLTLMHYNREANAYVPQNIF